MSKYSTLKQRLNACFILVIVFILMLISHELKRRNFLTVDQSVNSVFKDRVVALEYTYRLGKLFHKKELELATAQGSAAYKVNANDIDQLIENFSLTELTPEESVYFKRLQDDYGKLQSLENEFSAIQESESVALREEMSTLLMTIGDNLDQLSSVQLSEGRKLTQLSDKALRMNILISKLEVAFLIVIGLLILLIVFQREKPVMRLVD